LSEFGTFARTAYEMPSGEDKQALALLRKCDVLSDISADALQALLQDWCREQSVQELYFISCAVNVTIKKQQNKTSDPFFIISGVNDLAIFRPL